MLPDSCQSLCPFHSVVIPSSGILLKPASLEAEFSLTDSSGSNMFGFDTFKEGRHLAVQHSLHCSLLLYTQTSSLLYVFS